MTGSFIKAYVSPLTGKPRPLGLLIPKDYDARADKRWPLILLLHGIFADERQLSLMAWRLRDLGAIVCQAPSYRPLDWSGVSAAESWAGLDEVLKQYKIDPDRVYLIGHAIGGRGVWQMAEGRPDLWAACAPLLSGADTGPKWEATRLYPNQSHLILIGTPQNNSILAKMKESLPMKWTGNGYSMGGVEITGSGAGACFIQPNPLSADHYAVVVTANDEDGYSVWTAHGPSDDYCLGHAGPVNGKPGFITTAHGCFDNQWRWKKEDCVAP